eukprot:GHVS01079668.1.p1 GENE.GHVS01079668.1~~GHVS01079668.1.p1  ORF type:complete len:231 (-),score=64.20 GHVS01079668.1:237-929(-)
MAATAAAAAHSRSASRKTTVQIQRRHGRQSTLAGTGGGQRTAAADVGEEGSSSSSSRGTVVSDMKALVNVLQNVYPPTGFDYRSTILACNFPPNTTSQHCRNFFSWLAPVVRVDRLLPSKFGITVSPIDCCCQFLVVFANPSHTQMLLDLYSVACHQPHPSHETHLLKYINPPSVGGDDIVSTTNEGNEKAACCIYIRGADREVTWRTKLSDLFYKPPVATATGATPAPS